MVETQRISFQLDLGPRVPVQTVAAVIADFSTVCTFANELQRVADVNQALYLEARRWFDSDPDSRTFPWGSPYSPGWWGYSEAVIGGYPSRQIRERGSEDDAQIYVERLSYENPLEWIVIASGLVAIAGFELIRDWRARRRLNDAIASDYENEVLARKRVREIVVQKVDTGELKLSERQIDQLLTSDVGNAFRALGNSNINVKGLGEIIRKDKEPD